MFVRIMVKRYGYTELEVEDTSEIDDLISDMDETDFDWTSFDDDYEVVEEWEE